MVLGVIGLLAWILILAIFFAQVEIQIEGQDGWAANLPTWRIENHWLLNIFWGGRPMTGYHAWAFPFILLIFHLPLFVLGQFSWKLEMRILGSLFLFWIVEDFLWFVLNKGFGIRKFHKKHIPWHKRWFLFLPCDYWYFGIPGVLLLWFSYHQ